MRMRRGKNVFGRYVLLEPKGQGGMAEVWKAKLHGPHDFERLLGLKRILPHLSSRPEFVEMFVTEARLSARLNHPNIVSVFDFGEVDGALFLAMDFVDGLDVGTVTRALGSQLPLGLTAYIAQEVCSALGYAHSTLDDNGKPLRIVHRDVSPSNLMLAFDGSVRLVDFGIAKALGEPSDRTRTGVLKGKFSYMAPEFIEGAPFDHRCDIFALGAVLYELVTGARLFKADSDVHTLNLVRLCEVEPPSRVNPEVPPDLDAICLRALARDPAQRYQRAEQMGDDLAEVTHRLKWGRRETAELLKASPQVKAGLVPDGGTPTPSRPVTVLATRQTGAAAPRSTIVRWPLLACAGVMLTTGLAVALRDGWRAAASSPAAHAAIAKWTTPNPPTLTTAPATSTRVASAQPPTELPSPRRAPAPDTATSPHEVAGAADREVRAHDVARRRDKRARPEAAPATGDQIIQHW